MPEFSPAQRAYIRKRTKVHELDPSEAMDELNIVPFLDIVVNLIMFLLMTISTVAFFAQVEASLPQLGGGRPGPATDSLNLTVMITREGLLVSGSRGKLQPGCTSTQGAGRVITVPSRRPNDYDWNALTECVARVKQQFPEESQITISADPQVEFQSLISAMDAVRRRGSDELFPDVLLSAGVR